MQKRILIALSISFLVIGFYPMLLQHFYPEYGKQKAAASSKPGEVASKDKTQNIILGQLYSADKDVMFKNDKLRLVFNTLGGGVRQVSFLDYEDYEKGEPLRLVSLEDTKGAPLSLIFAGDKSSEKAENVMQMTTGSVGLQSTVMDGSVRVSKKLLFHRQGYSADMIVTIENISSAPKDVQYELFAGARIKPRHSIDGQYIETNFFSTREDKKGKLRHINDSKKDRETRSVGTVDWISAKDRHFSVVLKPEKNDQFTAVSRGLGNHEQMVSLVSPTQTIPAGGVVAHKFTVYMGPNDLKFLTPVGLDTMVNFGKFDLIAKLLVGGLESAQSIFKNYGVAIIILTILLNILLFPLTRQSYMSMKRMQLVQPQMIKLKEKYAKNPEQMHKESMELYKKHKVNPLGGCLPMLMQMPIFLALYVALSKCVPLVGAKFLWIHDLSSPDRVSIFGHNIHLLPIIMVVAMTLQQRFTQIKIEGQDPAMEQQQKIMAVMMPILFGFIFYAMPSGLVLYWLTNTLFTSAYQLRLKNMKIS